LIEYIENTTNFKIPTLLNPLAQKGKKKLSCFGACWFISLTTNNFYSCLCSLPFGLELMTSRAIIVKYIAYFIFIQINLNYNHLHKWNPIVFKVWNKTILNDLIRLDQTLVKEFAI
jgi:hypothetical protein